MIVLEVESEEELLGWYRGLKKMDPNATFFYEPDIDSYTAACLVVTDSSSLKKLPLLR